MEDQKLTFTFRCWKLSVETERYVHGGGLAVFLFCVADEPEPFAVASVNVPEVHLADDEFVFKTYSENEGLLEAMLAAGLVELTGRSADIGPICRFKTKSR